MATLNDDAEGMVLATAVRDAVLRGEDVLPLLRRFADALPLEFYAMFVVTGVRRFGLPVDVREVTRYTVAAHLGSPVKPREAEALIRGSLGELDFAEYATGRTGPSLIEDGKFRLVAEELIAEVLRNASVDTVDGLLRDAASYLNGMASDPKANDWPEVVDIAAHWAAVCQAVVGSNPG